MIPYNVGSLIDPAMLQKFDCGVDRINLFIKNDAEMLEKLDAASTTVFFDKESNGRPFLVGFYTINTNLIRVIPTSQVDKKLFQSQITADVSRFEDPNNHNLSFPGIELSFFAVQKEFQCSNKKYGTQMMVHLYNQLIKERYMDGLGFVGITLHALSDAVEFYTKLGFQYLHTDYDQVETLLTKDQYPMINQIDTIQQIIYD